MPEITVSDDGGECVGESLSNGIREQGALHMPIDPHLPWQNVLNEQEENGNDILRTQDIKYGQ